MTRTRLEKSLSAADHPILLETTAQLSEARKSWNGNEVLGIDTEFVRERTYRAELGLVQVSDGTTFSLHPERGCCGLRLPSAFISGLSSSSGNGEF